MTKRGSKRTVICISSSSSSDADEEESEEYDDEDDGVGDSEEEFDDKDDDEGESGEEFDNEESDNGCDEVLSKRVIRFLKGNFGSFFFFFCFFSLFTHSPLCSNLSRSLNCRLKEWKRWFALKVKKWTDIWFDLLEEGQWIYQFCNIFLCREQKFGFVNT